MYMVSQFPLNVSHNLVTKKKVVIRVFLEVPHLFWVIVNHLCSLRMFITYFSPFGYIRSTPFLYKPETYE